MALSRPPRGRQSTITARPALIDAAHYRHDSRQAALRAQYETAATAIRAEFLAEVARLRLSRDTTDLLVIARDLQKAGAGLSSLAEPVVDTTSDFEPASTQSASVS